MMTKGPHRGELGPGVCPGGSFFPRWRRRWSRSWVAAKRGTRRWSGSLPRGDTSQEPDFDEIYTQFHTEPVSAQMDRIPFRSPTMWWGWTLTWMP